MKKNDLKSMSIKYKIASMTIIVALIPMVVLMVLMLFFYNRAIMERGNRQIEENIRIMSDRISSVLKNGELCSNDLTIEFSSFYNDRNMKPVTRFSKITSQLSQSLLIYNGISSIVFIDTDGNFYSSDPSLNRMREVIKDSQYVKELEGENGKTRMMNSGVNVMNREDKEVVTMGKHVINIQNGSPIGYLFVNMNKDYLIESSQSEISYYFLYDTEGNCISESKAHDKIYSDEALIKDLLNRQDNFIRYDNESYLMAKDEIDEFHWTVVGITNLDRFNVTGKDLWFILLMTSSITAILLLISVIFSTILITRPLQILHDGAGKIAEGDSNYRFKFKTRDEIGNLGRIFNYMTQKNSELLERVDLEAKKKREYELALIQQQVKPHFLYNTLDIIIMLIDMNRGKEAMRVTKKLADYYKNTLSGSEEIVTIGREIQITRDYLDLQLMRYGDKFTYDIQVENRIELVDIPKMTLQPLVENAIYHGLKYREGWGNIKLTGKADGESAILILEDDGIGMEPETLEQLKKQFEVRPEEIEKTSMGRRNEKKHFGVYAVGHRLQLYFGDAYGLDIESTYGVGTKITIRVPMKRE